MKNILKKNKLITNTVRKIRKIAGISAEDLNKKFHLKNQKKIIEEYLQNNIVRKLQIGSQSNIYNDWLNTDLQPKTKETAFLNATETFPIPNDSFDYIFCEHMFEHINFKEGQFMLSECYRILKKGGKIRISTPDLNFLIKLYQSKDHNIESDYIKFSIDRYFKNKVPLAPVFVVNNFFYNFHHKFIHDKFSLNHVLKEAGFIDINFCEVGKSHDTNLNGLEKHGLQITEEFNLLESMVAEAIK